MVSQNPDNHDKQYLVVEDDDAHFLLIRRALKPLESSSKLHRVANGDNAVAYLRGEGDFTDREVPDVVLLDLNLPGRSGLEVLEIIKNDPQIHDIPVVILTTSRNPEDRAKAYRLGANSYVIKPVDFEQFVTAVRETEKYWTNYNTPPFDRQ